MPAALPPAEATPYVIESRISLGGGGHWDYAAFDARRQRVFITRGDHVEVLGAADGRMAGSIAGTPGVHGVAFAEDLGLGFTSNGKADTLTVFDLATLAVKGSYPIAGHNPDALLYDQGRLYSANGRSHDIDVLDARDGRVLQTIPVGGKPEFAAIDAGTLYINIEDTNELAAVDLAQGRVRARWSLPGCEEPTGLDIDRANHRVFSACGNGRFVVTDAATGRNLASLPIGKGPDALAWDATRVRAIVSSGEAGTLSVVVARGAEGYEVQATLPTGKGARTLAFDPATGRAWLPSPGEGSFTVIVVAPAR